ncbi:MAG: hypothetical protein ABI650_06080 [Dokdonella sp.]
MTLTTPQRLGLFALLALAMAATRVSHVGAFPDASWAVFLAAGFYLRGSLRWALPLLFALGVFIDFLVISGQGLNFWNHTCVSAAYWFLLPAYGVMAFAGTLLRKRYVAANTASAMWLIGLGLVATSLCFVISNGSFYWLAESVVSPTLDGWLKNLGDWYLPYMRSTAMYLAIGAFAHVIGVHIARLAGASSRPTATRG